MFNNSDALKELYPSMYDQSPTISGSRLEGYLQEMQMNDTAETTPITTSPLSPTAPTFVPHMSRAAAMSPNLPATTYCPMSLQCPGHACPSIYDNRHGQSRQNVGENATGCLFSMQQQQNLLMLQQQELIAAHQQLQISAAVTAAALQQQDEISNSLKMFAMMSALNTAAESSIMQHTPPLDMRDFANNGHSLDEFTQSQFQYENMFNYNNLVSTNTTNTSTYTLNEGLRNIWRMGAGEHLTSTTATVASTSTTGVVFNIENTNPIMNLPAPKRSSRRQQKSTGAQHCVFCENNNEPEAVVKSHTVRDSFGRVLCPKLRVYICPICKASGDEAHTIKYCPKKPIVTMDDALRADSARLAKSSGSGSSQQKQKMRV